MYENILLPTDGSDTMEEVIDHAVGLATHHDATLHALYVANTASLRDLPADSGWESITEALDREGERAISEVRTRAKPHEVSLQSEIREGAPAKEILRYAEEAGSDIVVMGTRGRSGVGRLLLGSVAEKVVRSSTTPVLTIRISTD